MAVADMVHLCEIVVIRTAKASSGETLPLGAASAAVSRAENPPKTGNNAASGRLPSQDGADISPATPTQRAVRT
jgi:hypothetical protein